MSLKRFTVGALVAFCIFVAQAAAQKNELSGILGRTFISDQGIQGAPSSDPHLTFGNGLTFEVNYARRVMGDELLSIALEVPFVVNADEDVHAHTNPLLGYRSYFVTPAARVNVFPEQAISPWVSFGGGFGYFSGNTGPYTSSAGTTTGVLQAGFGLDVRIFGHFSLRGEGRDFWSGVPQLDVNTGKSRQHNIFAGGGIVWHF
ncbi:MAG TPA: hypothetical protein VMU26_09625 [Candidatus Polarisedimenticolia bacterium]|nr:hypothetical protein [Candidatus Polarisedimenticolia bacterium]